MTRKQIAKLHTITAKLEALENSLSRDDWTIKERLASAKTELIRALNEIERVPA